MTAANLTTYNTEPKSGNWSPSMSLPPDEPVPDVGAEARVLDGLWHFLCGRSLGMGPWTSGCPGTAVHTTAPTDATAYEPGFQWLSEEMLRSMGRPAPGRLRPELSRAFDPPRVLRTGLPPNPSALQDHEWIKAHYEAYQGRWVALRNGELVAVGRTGSELRDRIGSATGLYITKLF